MALLVVAPSTIALVLALDQPVERVYKKLINAKWLVTSVCEMRDEGSAQASKPIIKIKPQAGGKTSKLNI